MFPIYVQLLTGKKINQNFVACFILFEDTVVYLLLYNSSPVLQPSWPFRPAWEFKIDPEDYYQSSNANVIVEF